MRPFPVQIMGALALRRGCLAEIATGEGKTLVASIAAVVAGWTGRPCNIITANDYLAHRDAKWLEPLYEFCGASVGFITGPMEPHVRRRMYARDVTYSTSKEVTADFLRDRLRLGELQNSSRRLIRELLRPHGPTDTGLVMRGLDTAIVDEADSLLIDEAVTPLIISSQQENAPLEEAYVTARDIAGSLDPDVDYSVDLKYKDIELRDAGYQKLEAECARLPGLWRGPKRRAELVRQALVAQEMFLKEKNYVIHEGRVLIVDEFTGRIMPQRTWSYGLHQAIEAKESLEITPPQETLARLSFQRFFRSFRNLSGMTGTACEAAHEFWHIYRLPFVTIPDNRPCIREHRPRRVFVDQESKWDAIVAEIEELHAVGRPILVGTRSVSASELLAQRLTERQLGFRLLNAVRHQEEAEIVKEAGELGRITIATNMAGRGTDIKLGPGVTELGGLHVVMAEHHESARIDRQLFGRSGRQGDPGSAQGYASIDDELIRRFVPQSIRRRLADGLRRGSPRAAKLAGQAISYAQYAAQRQAYKQRRTVLKTDTWLEDAVSSFAGVNI